MILVFITSKADCNENFKGLKLENFGVILELLGRWKVSILITNQTLLNQIGKDQKIFDFFSFAWF